MVKRPLNEVMGQGSHQLPTVCSDASCISFPISRKKALSASFQEPL